MIELLFAIGIIGLLFALLLPSVQSIREASRRTECQNHLRQIGLATHTFHQANRTLPSYFNGTNLKYPLSDLDLFHAHSWRVPLLAHLEQTSLLNKVAWNTFATEPANADVAQSVVPVFICPSAETPAIVHIPRRHGSIGVAADQLSSSDGYKCVRSDYDALAGIQVLPDPPDDTDSMLAKHIRWGAWGWPVFDTGSIHRGSLVKYRPGAFKDITDGLSNTILLVERAGKPTALSRGEPATSRDNPKSEYPGQTAWSASNSFPYAINYANVGVNENNFQGIYAMHPGGANLVLADGSVVYLSNSVDYKTLIQRFSRSGGSE